MNRIRVILLLAGVAIIALPYVIRPLPIEDLECAVVSSGIVGTRLQRLRESISLLEHNGGSEPIALEQIQMDLAEAEALSKTANISLARRLARFPNHSILGLLGVILSLLLGTKMTRSVGLRLNQ